MSTHRPARVHGNNFLTQKKVHSTVSFLKTGLLCCCIILHYIVTVQHFGKCSYLLSGGKLDEKIDTTTMFFMVILRLQPAEKGETDSLALSERNKIHLPASLQLTI